MSSSDSGSQADSGGDGGSDVSADQAATNAATAYCTRANACAPAYVTLGYGDVTTCTQGLKTSLLSGFSAPGTSSTPAQIEACAQVLPQASCADLLARKMPPACMPVAGKLANGAACGDDSQCVGTRCKVAKDAVCGTCTAPAAAGAACGVDGDCQPDMKCLNLVCTQYGDAGATCSATQPCRPDLGCLAGKCATQNGAGATCTTSDQCDQLHGVFCGPLTKKCENIAFAVAAGACGLVNNQLTVCKGPGSFCSGSSQPPYKGTCLAVAQDGASCDSDAGPLCNAVAVCVAGTCQLPDPASCH